MALVYLTPFESSSNEYINIIRNLIKEEEHVVRPLQPKSLRAKDYLTFFKADTFVVYHWVESISFKERNKGIAFSFSGFLKWIFYYLIALLGRARVIYFIHNHAVHDSKGLSRRFSSLLISIFSKAADVRIVHDPGCCEKYNAVYVPHPLYSNYAEEPKGSEAIVNTTLSRVLDEIKQPLYSIIGAIRPYKKIEDILQLWPSNQSLLIAGKASPEYLKYLQNIIDDRNISSLVKIYSSFLNKAELNLILRISSCIILPHEAGTGLVSGAFFEAIGSGCSVITRSSPFTRTMAETIPEIFNFEVAEDIPGILALRQKNGNAATIKVTIRESAEASFGDTPCREFLKRAMEID